MDSDLNFYISVKVINQTMNEKDRLVYKPLANNKKDLKGEEFMQIFGDSFISGFLEGGEFNAIVSMKVLNEDKKVRGKRIARCSKDSCNWQMHRWILLLVQR